MEFLCPDQSTDKLSLVGCHCVRVSSLQSLDGNGGLAEEVGHDLCGMFHHHSPMQCIVCRYIIIYGKCALIRIGDQPPRSRPISKLDTCTFERNYVNLLT